EFGEQVGQFPARRTTVAGAIEDQDRCPAAPSAMGQEPVALEEAIDIAKQRVEEEPVAEGGVVVRSAAWGQAECLGEESPRSPVTLVMWSPNQRHRLPRKPR